MNDHICTFHSAESLEEDWEKDFDIEVTEEDIRLAQAAASRISTSDTGNEVSASSRQGVTMATNEDVIFY